MDLRPVWLALHPISALHSKCAASPSSAQCIDLQDVQKQQSVPALLDQNGRAAGSSQTYPSPVSASGCNNEPRATASRLVCIAQQRHHLHIRRNRCCSSLFLHLQRGQYSDQILWSMVPVRCGTQSHMVKSDTASNDCKFGPTRTIPFLGKKHHI
jgi:hypothetical protein